MHELQMWVLSGVVSVSGIIIGFFFKTGFKLLVQLLSDIKEEIRKLTTITETHELKIDSIKEKLVDHEKRIRHLEFNQHPKTKEQ